jgi:hypothetical protein
MAPSGAQRRKCAHATMELEPPSSKRNLKQGGRKTESAPVRVAMSTTTMMTTTTTKRALVWS